MERQLLLCTFAVTTMIMITGCGNSESGPETAAVSGTVYLDGAPASGVEVNFINGEYTAFGRTDAEGRYEVVAGAAVGENKVYFTKYTGVKVEMDAANGMDEGQLLAMQNSGVRASRAPKQVIPAEYSDPTNTKVLYVVPDGGAEEADFKISTR